MDSRTHNGRNESWPTAKEIGNAILAEAECDAKRLGHKLVGWVAKEGKFYSRCCDCLEAIQVAPRHLGVARIRGVASMMVCVKKKPKR